MDMAFAQAWMVRRGCSSRLRNKGKLGCKIHQSVMNYIYSFNVWVTLINFSPDFFVLLFFPGVAIKINLNL